MSGTKKAARQERQLYEAAVKLHDIYGDVVAAPDAARASGNAWRIGHEDIAATGSYNSRKRVTRKIAPSFGGSQTTTLQEAKILLQARIHAIAFSVIHTLEENAAELTNAAELLALWMRERAPVRILGAGRALLAGAMPGNRLAHGGAHVSFMGGIVPLPNSALAGGIIACSASGKTRPVIDAMEVAKKLNPKIKIIGIADGAAQVFRAACDIFIGLRFPKEIMPNPLSALADTEEYMISEILDGLTVLAGKINGFDDATWRRGHEDIGPTGPYGVPKTVQVDG